MKIPNDLTHMDFGFREMSWHEVNVAGSFIWKGTEVDWLIYDRHEKKYIIGRDPIYNHTGVITLEVNGEPRRFYCPDVCNPRGLRYQFTLVRDHEEVTKLKALNG